MSTLPPSDRLDDLLAQLQSAPDDSAREWIVLQLTLERLSADVRDAVWAVAALHWFDAPFLAALLDVPAPTAEDLYQELQTLSIVEPYAERGHALHERARDMLLSHLWESDRDRARYRELSRRAAAHCAAQGREDPSWRIENVYHLLIADPARGKEQLIDTGGEWHNTPYCAYEQVALLARAAREHADARRLPEDIGHWVLFWEALLDADYSRYREAKSRYLQIPLADESDPRLFADVAFRLGDVHRMLDEYAEARARYEQALPVYREIGARLGEANAIKSLGDVHLSLDEYAEARARYEQALPVYREIGARLGEANAIQSLGDVHRMLDEYAEARARYEQALPVYREIGDRRGEANAIRRLGDVHLARGDDETSLNLYRQAATAYCDMELADAEAGTQSSMADVYERRGDYDVALALYTRAVDLAPKEPMWYRNRASAYIRRFQDAARARADLERAAALQPDHPFLALRRGDLALLEQDYGRALAEYRAFVEALPRQNGGHFGLGLTYLARGQIPEALDSYRQALSLTTDDHDIQDAVDELQELLDRRGALAGSDQVLDLVRQARQEHAQGTI